MNQENLLAIDFGQKNIGIAYKTNNNPVIPSDSIINTNLSDTKDRIIEICQKLDIQKIIIGLPLTLKGEIGHQAKIVKKFGQDLHNKSKLPVIYIDERFTSKIFSTPIDKIATIDSYSAMEILDSYLKRQSKEDN